MFRLDLDDGPMLCCISINNLFLVYLNGLWNLYEMVSTCASSLTKCDHPHLQMTQKRFRAAAMLVVFTVSAVVHEYVLAICFGFFYPVLFCLFMCCGSKNLIYYKSMSRLKKKKQIVLAGLSWFYCWPSWCLAGQQLVYQKPSKQTNLTSLGRLGCQITT